MTKTRGYAALAARADLAPFEFERRGLRDTDIGFTIDFAGICHSDIHQVREEWGPALFPMVPGHEIVGTVTGVGSKVTSFKVGDSIGVGVFIDSCRKCANCLKGLQQYCLEGMTGTYNGYERNSQTIAFGGYSNYFVIEEGYAVKVPSNLDPAGVAPLLCAGITLYSPIKHWKLRKKFDLILNTVSADLNLDAYLSTLATDGTLVIIGLPGKPYAINAGTMLDGRRSIAGSMIGGMPELQEMLDFCGAKNIVSDVEVIKADYINQAYERTVASDVKYRFVIDASSF